MADHNDVGSSPDRPHAWRKSSMSGGSDCLEIAALRTAFLVRDSKDRGGPSLAVSRACWAAFVAGLKDGAGPRLA